MDTQVTTLEAISDTINAQIAQLVGLQLQINAAYSALQSVSNEVTDLVCDGERITIKTVNEKGIVTPYSLMLYIKNYEIWYGRKPAFASKLMKTARNFETLLKCYKHTVKEFSKEIVSCKLY